ncbi:MAG: hypothetical protein ACUVRM_09740 [Bacillota bacterium]
MGTLRTRRAIMPCWTEVSPFRRTGLVGVTLGSLFLLFLALRHVRLHPDALVYLPAYLVFIYLFHQSWGLFLCTGARERFFVALGFSLSVLRYLLLFTPLEPYLDILTVLTFYSFAYSQALVFEESPRAFRFLKIVGFLSLAFYLAMVLDYWAWCSLGPRPYLFDRLRLETGIGPIWLLSSLGLLIGFLLYVHLRAALETDDFPIRLRLWFLVLSWLFFAAFFLRDEGVHFGWFVPNRKIYDLLLVLSIIFTQLGLAMPRPVERFLTSLYFSTAKPAGKLPSSSLPGSPSTARVRPSPSWPWPWPNAWGSTRVCANRSSWPASSWP